MSYWSDLGLLGSARQALARAPHMLGQGRAEAMPRTFIARRFGACLCCGRAIERGQRLRYSDEFDGPVHVGCQAASGNIKEQVS